MNIKKISVSLFLGILAFNSCKNTEKDEKVLNTKSSTELYDKKANMEQMPAVKTNADDTLATLVADYINNNFLKPEDKRAIPESDKKFSLYEADLNNDGKKEAFVYLNSPYFCGTGGCTILLLSPKQELITKFTVTKPPIFIEPTLKNGWKILTIKSGGEWKEVAYTNGSYPSNPSVLAKAPYDAPSGHAEIAFDEMKNMESYKF